MVTHISITTAHNRHGFRDGGGFFDGE